ncbi:60S ribosomal protein L14-like isoform X2 [Patiria miniata]|uniref:Large ribosomal subunit protein eL14 n=1 Tax=Patiria miniata TaxID=46514 RepID=A0A914ATF8_PATMI|nr:60S ribosomal protein L14-like isoform X2 [Patiria miniata]
MVFERFVEIGRVAFVAVGRNRGKLCAIVDVIDQKRALVDGPCTRFPRQQIRLKKLHLTAFKIRIPHSARTGTVRNAWEKAEIDKKWRATTWARKLDAKKRKANMTDFDRYKLMIAKKKRTRIINGEVNKLKKAKKAAAAAK